jgi:prephenate dehydrogenase/3-phosphoshikimate 1-carboxyvinyltransferase
VSEPLAARTTIVGVGLLGASLAAAGRRAGVLGHVVGVGRSRANLELALASGAVDEIGHDVAAAVTHADLVILAAPVEACMDLLTAVAAACGRDCVITDVASVKAPMVARARHLHVESRFVGAHPMAGGTATGAAAANADLFAGRTTVLTPSAVTDQGALARVRALWTAIGAEVVEMDAAEHDRVVALASHLPQLLAFALCAALAGGGDESSVRRLAGSGLRDTTRLAASDAAMWTSIARSNRDAILAAMERFDSTWTELRGAVSAGDGAELARIMNEARAFKGRLGG